MKLKQFYLAVALATGLSACGGGGGGGSSDSDSSANISASAANGIYVGTGTEYDYRVEGSIDYSLVAIVYNEEVHSMSDLGNTYYGVLEYQSETNYQGFLRIYDDFGDFYRSIRVDGQYETKNRLAGQYASPGEYDGSFSMDYVPEAYEAPASIDLIDGAWNVTNSVASASLSIDSSGNFFGSDADGCVFSGKITVPDPAVNVYRVNLSQENCGDIDGSYSGLASLDTTGESPILLTIVSNTNFSFPYLLERP